MTRIPVVWLCGPPGVGKTAVAWDIYRRLLRAKRAPAYVDVDQLGMCYPESAIDPARHMLKARNVGVVRTEFSAAGAQCLVVSGVVDANRGPDANAVGGGEIIVCRLRVDPAELVARLGGRRGSFAQPDSAVREAERLDQSSIADFGVDTTGLTVNEVADRVLAHIGDWPHPIVERDVPLPDEAGGDAGPAAVLWLCGPTGVGKSTVGFNAYVKVLRSGVRTAYLDVDQLAFGGASSGDHHIRARNLAGLCRNFRAAGAEAVVVVGPVATVSDTRVYEASLSATAFTWCRLHADQPELTRRILSRRDGGSWAQPGDPLRGRPIEDLLEVAANAARREHTDVGLRIDVDGLTVDQAADSILARTRWPAAR